MIISPRYTRISRLTYLWLLMIAAITIMLGVQFSSAPVASQPGDYQVQLTIDHTKVSSDLTDFPAYVDLADMPTGFWGVVTATCGDIRAYQADGITEIAREVVGCDTTAQTGEIYIQTDLSSTADTDLIVQVDGTSDDYPVTGAYGSGAVWADDLAVYHMNEDPSLAAPQMGDSSTNAYNLTANSIKSANDRIGGKLGGYAVSLSGDQNDFFRYDNFPTNVFNAGGTVSLWFRGDVQTGRNNRLFEFGDDTNRLSMFLADRKLVAYQVKNSRTFMDIRTAADYDDNSWHHAAITWNSTNATMFVDGVEVLTSSGDKSALFPSSANFFIGQYIGGGNYTLAGDIDEAKFSGAVRSSAWIATEYINQNNSSNFYSLRELARPTTRYTLTIDHTKVASDLTNFPVYVNLNDVKPGITKAEADSVRVYKADGTTELPREIVSKDEMHFKADSLSAIADTRFFVDIDGQRSDYSLSAPYGAENVWSNGYGLVSHDSGGSDSTSNGYDGVGHGGVLVGGAPGKLGSATSFDGVNDYSQFGGANVLNVGDGAGSDYPFSISGWINIPSDGAAYLFSKADSEIGDWEYYFRAQNGDITFRIYDYIYTGGSRDRLAKIYGFSRFNQWVYLTVTYDGSKTLGGIKTYVDSQFITETSNEDRTYSGARTNTSSPRTGSFGFGGRYQGLTKGITDELRFSQTARSDSWIATEYTNQSNASTFYSVAEATGGLLSADVVDSSGNGVANPMVSMSPVLSDFECVNSTGMLGVPNQRIRLENTISSPSWSLSLAATDGASALWSGEGSAVYDYNDPTGSPAGCSAGSDDDTYAGLLSVNFDEALLSPQSGCSANGVAIGANNHFEEGVRDVITLLSADASAMSGCYWDLTGLKLEQRIPAEQPAGDYALSMTLTVVAN